MRQRLLTPEIMDDPALDANGHLHALQGLERINRFSRSARLVWSLLEPLARAHLRQPLRVLDIATGAGDIPISLHRMAARIGARLEIEGCDVSLRAVEFARKRADEASATVKFFVHDVVSGAVPDGYDVMTSSLFFHHLPTADATNLLTQMARQAREAVVVNDLLRSRTGWLLAKVATRVLSRSPVVHVDGPLSVAAAFSMSEIQQMAGAAGLSGCTIQRRFPCRFLLGWRRTIER